MASNLQTKAFARLRGVSFAGDGLPERMRSTAFAFLGLTAAAGLALVAIFAQPGFPLLSPPPLPSEPAAQSAVARAVALHPDARRAFERPAPGVARPGGGSNDRSEAGFDTGGGRGAEPAAALPAAPTATDPGGGTSGGSPVETPTPKAAPAPAPAPEPSSEPAATTADDRASAPAPAPKPAPVPARPAAPTPPAAPGNSQSSAAASHASERGVEASSKSTSEATGVAAGGTGAIDTSPGSGNGKALGHGK